MSAPTQAPAAVTGKSLPSEIHAATRFHHTSLNRLITSRLPLCLPPYAQDSSVYASGMSAFAEIYFTFEREWAAIISSSAEVTDKTISPRIQNLLCALYHPSLLRTTRLKHDLYILFLQQNNHESLRFSTLTSQISYRIRCRPHTLLAYTWIMYLALFNGGRWIRSQLLSTCASTSGSAPRFWPNSHTAEECLTFWHFDGDRDGEDVKDEFKVKFEAIAAQLGESERGQIVDEAVEVFKICGTAVELLDRVFGAEVNEKQKKKNNNNPKNKIKKTGEEKAVTDPPPQLLTLPLVARLTSQLWCIFHWVWSLVLPPLSIDNPHPPGWLHVWRQHDMMRKTGKVNA